MQENSTNLKETNEINNEYDFQENTIFFPPSNEIEF